MRVRQMNPFTGERNARPPAPAPSPAPAAGNFPFGDIMTNLNIKKFKKDDWILLGIICALVLEGSRDYVLLCSLGYLFLMGFKE